MSREIGFVCTDGAQWDDRGRRTTGHKREWLFRWIVDPATITADQLASWEVSAMMPGMSYQVNRCRRCGRTEPPWRYADFRRLCIELVERLRRGEPPWIDLSQQAARGVSDEGLAG